MTMGQSSNPKHYHKSNSNFQTSNYLFGDIWVNLLMLKISGPMITQNMRSTHTASVLTSISPFTKYLIDQLYHELFVRIARVQHRLEKCNYNIKSL